MCRNGPGALQNCYRTNSTNIKLKQYKIHSLYRKYVYTRETLQNRNGPKSFCESLVEFSKLVSSLKIYFENQRYSYSSYLEINLSSCWKRVSISMLMKLSERLEQAVTQFADNFTQRNELQKHRIIQLCQWKCIITFFIYASLNKKVR